MSALLLVLQIVRHPNNTAELSASLVIESSFCHGHPSLLNQTLLKTCGSSPQERTEVLGGPKKIQYNGVLQIPCSVKEWVLIC